MNREKGKMEIQAFTFIRPDAFVDIIVSNETTPSIVAPAKNFSRYKGPKKKPKERRKEKQKKKEQGDSSQLQK